MLNTADFFPDHLIAGPSEVSISSIQALVDLDYLDQAAIDAPSNVHEAVAQFRRDVLDAGVLSADDLGFLHLLPVEEHQLAQFTELDGDVEIGRNLVLNQKNLASRILGYRMEVYGLTPDDSTSFTPFVHQQLLNLKGDLGFDDLSVYQFADLLGNAPKLIQVLISKGDLHYQLAYFQSDDRKLKSRLKNNNRAFDRYLVKHFGSGHSVMQYDSLSRSEILNRVNEQSNKFLIRLCQVQLWMLGHYSGRLDSSFGFRTAEALDDFLDDEDVKFHAVCTELLAKGDKKTALGIINVMEVFELGIDNFSNREEASVADELAHSKKLEKIDERLGETIPKAQEELLSDVKAGRRIYIGAKRILQGIGQTIRRIVSGVKQLLEKFKRWIGRMARYLVSTCKQAIRQFGLGMKLLLGDRTIISGIGQPQIASKFDFDFDQVQIVDREASVGVMSLHLSRQNEIVSAMGTALKLTAGVIEWAMYLIKMSNPIGWVSLAFRLIELLKKSIERTKP